MGLQLLDLTMDPLEIIERHFIGAYSGNLALSSIPGGQSAADNALKNLDITGYAKLRSEVLPRDQRGASVLSPYIRHNILTLKEVYDSVNDAPYEDREKFRYELYWQEYARHLYARIGTTLFENLRFDINIDAQGDGWNREMACIDTVLTELESDGWLVNQSRMWLASHWSVRNKKGWLHGQERMYRELIDGSRAANLLGWQWTVGAGTGKPYGFARWQVEKRAPGICQSCPLQNTCPIESFPDESSPQQLPNKPLLDSDPHLETTIGPGEVVKKDKPEFVFLTVDSLGDGDPALAAHPDLPVIFIFNESALAKLQLSAKRLGFYLQTLQDLARRRDVKTYLGDPYQFAAENKVALTFAPVPSFKKFHNIAEIHPYPWFKLPHSGSVRSFTSWYKRMN
jgi:deoxyribodipyrimidine photo-lyase